MDKGVDECCQIEILSSLCSFLPQNSFITLMVQAVRFSKILLLFALGLMTFFIALTNILDYQANLAFVKGVLSMNDIFMKEANIWRSITHPVIHHIAYWVLILFEAVSAIFCLWGAIHLWKNRKQHSAGFHEAKLIGFRGLIIGLSLWLVGFVAIGGEFFLMWRSEIWNAQATAFSLAIIYLLSMMYIRQRED